MSGGGRADRQCGKGKRGKRGRRRGRGGGEGGEGGWGRGRLGERAVGVIEGWRVGQNKQPNICDRRNRGEGWKVPNNSYLMFERVKLFGTRDAHILRRVLGSVQASNL